jgi:hypothetical protein
MLVVIMVNVIMLNAVMLNAVMLHVEEPKRAQKSLKEPKVVQKYHILKYIFDYKCVQFFVSTDLTIV